MDLNLENQKQPGIFRSKSANSQNQQTRGLIDDEFQEYDPSILTQDSRPQQTTHQYRSQSTNYNSNYVINTNNNNIRHHSINYITHNNGNYYSSINDIKDYGDDSSIDSISNDDDWKNTVLKLINKYNGKISNNVEIGDINLNVIDVNSQIQNEIDKLESLQMHLKRQQNISNQTQNHNNELYKKVNELKKEKNTLKLEIQKEKSKIQNSINNTNNNDNNNNNSNNDDNSSNDSNSNQKMFDEYPPESTVIQNLLQAQMEFYFSDYNLKRDKRLLQEVAKGPDKGFLTLKYVLQLSRIRQLCSEPEQLINALKRSCILSLKYTNNDDSKENNNNNNNSDNNDTKYDNILVGRNSFERPREKEFPFRRTVFIFGIPNNEDESFLKDMLKPFGTVNKIQFDHGPDTLDRRIGQRFLMKPRVYQLFTPKDIEYVNKIHMNMDNNNDNNGNITRTKTLPVGQYHLDYNEDNTPIKMEFKTKWKDNSKKNIECSKCLKSKPVTEGFYTSNKWKKIFCAQCSAVLADEQLNQYYKDRSQPKHVWLGHQPKNMDKTKTALVVFASQRQASKSAYVRTRISYKGAFATHFHHYSKIKKEIALMSQNNNTNQNEHKMNNNINNHNNNNNQRRNRQPNNVSLRKNSRYYTRGSTVGNNNNHKYNNNQSNQMHNMMNLNAPPTNWPRHPSAPVGGININYNNNNNNNNSNQRRYKRNNNHNNHSNGSNNHNNNNTFRKNFNNSRLFNKTSFRQPNFQRMNDNNIHNSGYNNNDSNMGAVPPIFNKQRSAPIYMKQYNLK